MKNFNAVQSKQNIMNSMDSLPSFNKYEHSAILMSPSPSINFYNQIIK